MAVAQKEQQMFMRKKEATFTSEDISSMDA